MNQEKSKSQRKIRLDPFDENPELAYEKCKDLTSGYVNKVQSLLPPNNIYYTIPEPIFDCILLYHFVNQFEAIKFIRGTQKYLIGGYVRELESIFFDDNIPSVIYNWILLFYVTGYEKFHQTLHHQGIDVTNTWTSSIKKTATSSNTEYAYLCSTVHYGEHAWRFKLIKCNGIIDIGIRKASVNDENDEQYLKEAHHKYAYQVTNARLKESESKKYSKEGSYGVKCKSGDIVEMELDITSERQLKFIVNGQDCGAAYDEIKLSQYRAMVGLTEKDDKVELMQYQRTKYW